ncbi:MAG: fused MFS/spermidine synthase, partial [Bdellovibrionales bacterium]|nr:fused MFS/spermidine synthase [Bdellovibrionales bacterium]
MLLPSLTITVSSFLLFLIQPMIGKYILPWHGGVPSVWTTCLLFFQAALLFGYGYAHVLTAWSNSILRALVHGTVLLLGAIALFFQDISAWAPTNTVEHPTLHILAFLTCAIGIPYLALSSTTPLVQGVLGAKEDNPKLYRLYSLSNAASLIALFGYPLLIEQFASRSIQISLWSFGFLLYSTLIFLLLKTAENTNSPNEITPASITPSPLGTQLQWLILSGIGCMLLLSSTNHICQNVASIPFLWIIPLSLYLLSFVVAFAHEKDYGRIWYFVIFISSSLLLWFLESKGLPSLISLLTCASIVVFSGCMICHGELSSLKPATQHLTRYYFILSIGSVIGSFFVAIVAPKIFTDYREFVLSLVLIFAIAIIRLIPLERMTSRFFARTAFFAVFFVAVGFVTTHSGEKNRVAARRNFFGVLTVAEENRDRPDFHILKLRHGEVVHGIQFQSPGKRDIPTTYYSEQSGIGRLLSHFRPSEVRNIGAIGLGIGTVAALTNTRDHLSFFEINPQVLELAEEYFTFLKDSKGEVSHFIGDGRLLLQSSPPQQFDILLLDAFSGDSVPMHLLTVEALQEYQRHMKKNGVIAFHLTNYYLDLVPVV